MGTNYSITEYFGKNLASRLADKIVKSYPAFDKAGFVSSVGKKCMDKTYTQRVELLADELNAHLPHGYKKAVGILLSILGPENPKETGMFSDFYWIMPIGKFVEKQGLNDFDTSIHAIAEITKRNTGEYAIRPFIRKYPKQTLKQMKIWAMSENFHLRRLSSEGLRPRLPWALKLDTFLNNPQPVFEILEILKEDQIRFVKKSVANHLRDWLKVNHDAAMDLIHAWRRSKNQHTKWILARATRKTGR